MEALAQAEFARAAVVYRFFDAEGALLYVGITVELGGRLNGHARMQPWWREAATATLTHHPDIDSARVEELQAIRTEKPRYNVADVPRPPKQLWLINPRLAGMRPVLTSAQRRRQDAANHRAVVRAFQQLDKEDAAAEN